MLLLLLLALLVVVVLIGLERRVAALSCLALTFILVYGVGTGLVVKPVMSALQKPALEGSEIIWGQRNAIILLGMSTEVVAAGKIEPGFFSYGRITKAAQAYRECKMFSHHCTLIVSGGDPRHHDETEAQSYNAVLKRLGVRAEDLLPEDKSANTWQNAQYSAALLAAHSFSKQDNVVLVTSAFHMQRSMLYFTRAGITAHPLRADYIGVEPGWLPQSYNLVLADLVLHEYVGMWRTDLYDRLGFNPPSARR